MRGRRWLLPVLVISMAGWTTAQAESSSLAVERSAIAERVVDREPVEEATTFAADIGQVACFTRIIGAEGEEVIYHVWRHQGQERAKVELTVRGATWRTWSTKKIVPSWTGEWTVEVQDADGNVLKTLSFTVEDGGGTTGTGR